MADSLAHEGYKVFDDNGKVVYTPKVKESTVIHTVVKGDTLWSISQKYGVTVDDIKKKNGLKDDIIYVGQKLTIKTIKGDTPKQDEKLIAIDDGHGMSTAGKRTPVFPDGTKSPETGKNFMHENEFNRAVKRYLDKHLRASGFKTILVAKGDEDVPLATRVARANNAKADLYVSIHANALTGKWGTHGGTETYVYMGSKESERIGRIIHKHLMQGTPLRDRGVKKGNHLYVLRNTKMPAVLVECAFMDNLEEAKLLLSDAFRRECAREIAMGICEAYGVKFKDGVDSSSSGGSSSTDKLYRVRKTWGDAKSQKGAYKDLNNAKKLADSLKSQGYKVFDWNGKVVYDPNPQKTEEDDNKWYRVRKSWEDAKTQLGAFKS